MHILFSFRGAVSDHTGEKSTSIEMAESTDISSLLQLLIAKYPKVKTISKYLFISVNGSLATRDRELSEGDVVELFFRMGGG